MNILASQPTMNLSSFPMTEERKIKIKTLNSAYSLNYVLDKDYVTCMRALLAEGGVGFHTSALRDSLNEDEKRRVVILNSAWEMNFITPDSTYITNLYNLFLPMFAYTGGVWHHHVCVHPTTMIDGQAVPHPVVKIGDPAPQPVGINALAANVTVNPFGGPPVGFQPAFSWPTPAAQANPFGGGAGGAAWATSPAAQTLLTNTGNNNNYNQMTGFGAASFATGGF
jgi:hypothetical protein